jgi:hypothetical protein
MLQWGQIGYGNVKLGKGAENSHKARGNSKKRGSAKANQAKKRRAKSGT